MLVSGCVAEMLAQTTDSTAYYRTPLALCPITGHVPINACNAVPNAEFWGITQPTNYNAHYWESMGFYSENDVLLAHGYSSPTTNQGCIPSWTWASHSPNFAQPTATIQTAIAATVNFTSFGSSATGGFNTNSGCINAGTYYTRCTDNGGSTTTSTGGSGRPANLINCSKVEEGIMNDAVSTIVNPNSWYFFALREQHFRNSLTATSIGIIARLLDAVGLNQLNAIRVPPIGSNTLRPTNADMVLTAAGTTHTAEILPLRTINNLSPNSSAWARLGNTFQLPNTFTPPSAALWISPINTITNIDDLTWDNVNGAFFNIDNVELMEDTYPANTTTTSTACAQLGGNDYCMLTGVTVQYIWRDPNGNVVLSYTLTHRHDGVLLVNGVVTNTIPKITPTMNGNYKLTRSITNYDGLNSTDLNITGRTDLLVTVSGIPALALQVSPAACGTATIACTNAPTGYYQWSNQGSSFPFAQGGNLYTVTVSATGTYVLNVAGCYTPATAAVTTAAIPVYNCLAPQSGYTAIGVDSFSTTNISAIAAVGTATSVSNVQWYVQGTLTIDHNLALTGGTIYMGPGACIVVASGSTFGLTNLIIQGTGCRLWRGIEVLESNPVLTATSIIIDNCTIQDAFAGVTLHNKRRYAIVDTKFLNNRVGLKVPREPITGGGGNILHDLITTEKLARNTFKTIGNLLPPFCNQRGAIGIEFNDMFNGLVDIPDPNGLTSGVVTVFDNLNFGILVRNTSVTIGRTKFTNMELLNNAAVYAENSDLTIANHIYQNANYTRTFDNCYYGIRSSASRIAASYNTMTNTQYGIYATIATTNSVTTPLSITNNTLTCSQRGIFVGNSLPNFSGSINDNIITMSNAANSANVTGIWLSGTGSFTNALMQYNRITLNKAQTGIYLNNIVSTSNTQAAPGLFVSTNTITLTDPTNVQGILLAGGQTARIKENTITGVPPSSTARGIWVSGSKSNAIVCNTVDKIKEGIVFSGDCTISGVNTSEVGRNQFGKHTIGLYYTGTAITGDQKLNGNIWSVDPAACSTNAAQNDNVAALLQSFDKYTVNPNQATGVPNTTFDPPTKTPGWFYYPINPNDPNKGCNDLLRPAAGSSFDYSVATGDLSIMIFEAGLRWTAERALLNKIAEDPTMLQDSVLADFAAQKAQESVGIYNNLEAAAIDVLTPSAAAKQQLENYDLQMTGLLDDMRYLDALQTDPTLTVGQLNTYRAQYDGKVTQLKLVQENMTTLQTALNNANEAELNALLATNGAAPSVEIFEQNEKLFNSIYYVTTAKGNYDFTAQQRDDLLAIAGQCPYSGGDAVFKARTVCALFDETVYDDRSLCAAQGVLWRIKKPKAAILAESNALQVRVYPNPTASQTTVFVGNTHTDLQLTLNDALGRTLAVLPIVATVSQIAVPLDATPAGLYVLTLRDNAGNTVYQQKVNVIK